MAYGKRGSSRKRSKAAPRRSYSRGTGARRRSSTRRRTTRSPAQQTLRIVIEKPTESAVFDPTRVKTPNRARF